MSRAHPAFRLRFRWIHPALFQLHHNRERIHSRRSSGIADARKTRMNKCLPVHVPQAPFKPAGLGPRGPAKTGVGLRRMAPNGARHSLGYSLLGLSGSAGSPTLTLMLLRVLDAVAQWAGVFHKRSARGQVFPGSSHGADAMLIGSEPPRTRPSPCPLPALRGEGDRWPGEGKFTESSRGSTRRERDGQATPAQLLVALAEPSHNGHAVSFRGVWTRSRPGDCFERNRLMRLHNQTPVKDSGWS